MPLGRPLLISSMAMLPLRVNVVGHRNSCRLIQDRGDQQLSLCIDARRLALARAAEVEDHVRAKALPVSHRQLTYTATVPNRRRTQLLDKLLPSLASEPAFFEKS